MSTCNPYEKPLRASAVDGEVVVTGEGAFCGSFVPQALLASLEPLRRAAEEALAFERPARALTADAVSIRTTLHLSRG